MDDRVNWLGQVVLSFAALADTLGSRRFTADQSGFCSAKTRWRSFVQFRMDLYVARRDFRVRQKFDIPFVAGNFVFFGNSSSTPPRERHGGTVQFGYSRSQRFTG